MLSRLKFNLSGLANEMLDQLPEQVFISDSTTFYDPAMGGGQFIIEVVNRLRKYGHSENNISKRIFGSEENKLRVNYVKNLHKLPGEYKVGLIENMKFDVVIGNPPYQGMIEGNKGKVTIFDNFILDGLKICSQFLIMVTPGSFLSTSSRFKVLRKELKNNGLKQIYSHNYFPGQTIADPIYFLVDKNYSGDILRDTNYIKNDKADSPIVVETPTKKLFDKIIRNTPSKLKVIQGDANPKGVFRSNKERYKDQPEGEFIYPYVSNNLKDGFRFIYVKENDFKPHVNSNQRVLIFNERYDKINHRFANLRELENAHSIGFNVNSRGIIFNLNGDVNQIKEYLNSKIFRFLIKETSTTNTGMSFKLSIARQLPDWNNDFSFLTQEEIDLIESTIK